MKHSSTQPLITLPVALAGAAVLVLPMSAVAPATPDFQILSAAVRLLSGDGSGFAAVESLPAPGQGVALLMGGSGVPFPGLAETQWAFDHYSQANVADFGDYVPVRVFTPEGAEPAFGGIKSLPYDKSVAQGVLNLEAQIAQQLQAGHPVAVGGVSQSGTVNSEVLSDIATGKFVPDYSNLPAGVTPLQFLSLGSPSNPNGGFLERFNLAQDPGGSITSIGLTFDGGTPSDTGIPLVSYCLEYDPNCDFPIYTQNVVSDLNAMAGWALVHPHYILRDPEGGSAVTAEQIANAIQLPTSEGYDGGSTYYLMPWDGQLPLATVIQMIAGKPIADLLEPDLKVLANLGYGVDPATGWSTLPADVATPLRASPTWDAEEFKTILDALWSGAKQGFNDFVDDLVHPAAGLGGMSGLLDATAAETGSHSPIDIASTLSSLWSTVSSLGLPASDITSALTVELPAHELTGLMNSLGDGLDLGEALSLTSAFATGLESLAGGFAVIVGLQAVQQIQADLAQLF